MEEIEESSYNANLLQLIEKKIPQIKHKNEYELKQKLTFFLVQKGYRYEEISSALASMK